MIKIVKNSKVENWLEKGFLEDDDIYQTLESHIKTNNFLNHYCKINIKRLEKLNSDIKKVLMK